MTIRSVRDKRRLDNDLSPNELFDIKNNIKSQVQNMSNYELQDTVIRTFISRVVYMDKHDLILNGWLKKVDKKTSQGDNNEQV